MQKLKPSQFEAVFLDSFDTFKVFDHLTAQETGRNLPMAPKTIWQILNHLIAWQDHHLLQLQNTENEIEINEKMTWIEEEQCGSQERLDEAVAKFENQLEHIKEEISMLGLKDMESQEKLKVVQDLSVHLSFHIGEIILMRRMRGNYALPHQMKGFLG